MGCRGRSLPAPHSLTYVLISPQGQMMKRLREGIPVLYTSNPRTLANKFTNLGIAHLADMAIQRLHLLIHKIADIDPMIWLIRGKEIHLLHTVLSHCLAQLFRVVHGHARGR